MEAWNVYLAVRIDLNPSWHAILDCVPEDYHLHQFQVRTLHGYDVKFRIKAASDPSLKWDVLDSGLWLECKTAHSVQSTRWPFSNCGSTTHYPNNCLICFSDPSCNEGQQHLTGWSFSPTSQQKPTPNTCGDYNHSTCNCTFSKFSHRCEYCGENHRGTRCSVNGQPRPH